MPEALMQTCAAGESSARRAVRYASGALLVLIALVELAMACLMYAGERGTPRLLYLLCSLTLFAAAVVAVRERHRALIVVQGSAIAAAVMLFWSISGNSGPSAHVRDLTPVFAGMLLAALLLPRLLRERAAEAACNCQ